MLYRIAGISNRQIWGLTKPLLLAFVLFFLLNFPFATPLPGETIYFYVLPNEMIPVTASAILSGLASAIRFVFFIWVADLITSITPTGDIVLTMSKAKCPPEASIAIGIAFSYIPVLKNEIGTVIEAQKSRGASFESKNPIKKIKAYIPVIVPGLFISILKGREIARAIEARGFTYEMCIRDRNNGADKGSLTFASGCKNSDRLTNAPSVKNLLQSIGNPHVSKLNDMTEIGDLFAFIWVALRNANLEWRWRRGNKKLRCMPVMVHEAIILSYLTI